MMLSDVPNLIQVFGYTNASWTLKADLTCNYLARLLRYMDRRGLRVAVARRTPDVQEQPFIDFTSGYVQRAADIRSEEHTSELQSRPHLVCRLLLEKKKR